MKLFVTLFFLFAFLKSPIFAQTDPCENEKPLKIKIFDRFGFEKTTNFCQGEEVTFKIDGNFDRYIWGINNDNSDQNRAYFYEPNFKIQLPSNQIHITISAFKKGEACYAKGSKLLNNFITTQRNLIITDSAFVGEDFVISTNYHIPGDILYTPYDTVFNFSGFRNESFQANKAGVYRLVNEEINNSCGNHDIEKTVYLTNNKAPTFLEISGSTNMNFCEGWLLELGLKPLNLKIKNPQYIVYISNSPTIIKDSYYEQLAAIYNQNGFIVKPNFNFSGKYLFIREQLSGVYSNVIGPFNSVEKTKATKENLEIIQYPQTILAKGDSTSFQLKTDLKGKVFWMDNGNILSEQSTKLKIKGPGNFWPIFTYTDQCFYVNDVIDFVKVTQFESIIPKIKVATSCEKQAHIELELDQNYRSKGLVNIIWKKDGKKVNETDEFGLLVTEFGNYSCEIWFKNKFIESNILQIKEFKNYQNRLDAILGIDPKNPCQVKIYQIYPYFNFNLFDSKIQWFVNDTLQNFNSYLFEYPAEKIKENTVVHAVLKEGLCEYASSSQKIGPKYKLFQNQTNKYEFCEGTIANIKIEDKFFISYNSLKYDWYLNDVLFNTSIASPNTTLTAILTTNKPGKYYLLTTFLNENGEVLCVNQSESFEVFFKKEITLPENAFYLKELCPTIPKLNLKLDKTSLLSFYWQFNKNNKPDDFKSESRATDMEQIETIYLKQPGEYQGIATYSGGCVAKTQPFNYDGNHFFEIEKGFNKETEYFCNNEYLIPKNDWDNQNINFTYVWNLNNEILPNETFPSITPKKLGIYELYVRHIEGNCILKSKPFTVKVPNFDRTLNFSDSLFICEGSSEKISISDNSNSVVYWYNENLPFINKPTIEISKAGNYQALIKSKQCPSDYYFSNSLKVNELTKASASISGSANIDYGKTTDLKIELNSSPPWQVKLNTGEEFTIEKSPHILTVRPLSDVNYTLASVKNICGLGTTSGQALVKILVLGDEANRVGEPQIWVFPVPVSDILEVEIQNHNEPIAEISLVNNFGMELQNHILFSRNNEFNKSLNINTLPAGMYTLNIKLGQKTITKKIIKK